VSVIRLNLWYLEQVLELCSYVQLLLDIQSLVPSPKSSEVQEANDIYEHIMYEHGYGFKFTLFVRTTITLQPPYSLLTSRKYLKHHRYPHEG